MRNAFSNVKLAGRAAVLVLAMGSAAIVTTAPAQAQPGPSFSLQLGGGSSGFSFGFGNQRRCLSDSQIRRYLQSQGWRDVQIVGNLGNNRVRVVARWNRQWYDMRVNRCNGAVDRVRQISRGPVFGPGPNYGFGPNYGPGPGGGFGLQFNFGN